MSISTQIVSVAIVLGTRAAAAANLQVPAIFCDAPFVGGKFYELSSEGLQEMLDDGFDADQRGYLLASVFNTINPHPDQVLVYKRAALTTSVVDWTPLVTTEGAVYSFDLTYKNVTSTIEYTVGAASSVNAICDAVEILIDASLAGIAGAAVAPDNATATKLTFTGATPGEPVILTRINHAMIKVLDTSSNAGIATDLAAAAGDHNFYGFVIDSFSEAENNAAAAWAVANSKIFFGQSGDSTNIVDAAGTGVATDFAAAAYNRATIAQSPDGMTDAGAAAMATALGSPPGTSSLAYKELEGIVAGAIKSGQLTIAENKNILLYALDNAEPQLWFGKMASGRPIRIQQALDLLDVRMREAVKSTFKSNAFIPMSDEGFSLQVAAVRGVLSAFAAQGIILPAGGPGGYTVTAPKVTTISDADKIAGVMRNLKFFCTMPTDMIRVVVNGVVSF